MLNIAHVINCLLYYCINRFSISEKYSNECLLHDCVQVLETFGCELCIVVTNLNRMCSEYCSPTRSPNLPVRDAVRMSMSFPCLFHVFFCLRTLLLIRFLCYFSCLSNGNRIITTTTCGQSNLTKGPSPCTRIDQ